MNYHNITKNDMLNGQGLRVVLWVAGCSHNCPECHNPITHDVNGGIPFDDSALLEIETELQKSYIKGITFSGGDPLHPLNRQKIKYLAQYFKEKYPNKDIWLYTGYSWETIKNLEIMKHIDILVDGNFIVELKDEKLHWKGSSNQRVIDVQKSLSNNQLVIFVD